MKEKKIAFGGLLLILVGLSFHLFFKPKISPVPHHNDDVENEEIIAPALVDSLNDIIHIPTLQAGLITKIHVSLGQKVKKGQALFALDDTAAKQQVLLNKIAVDQAKNNLIIQTKSLQRITAQLVRLESLDKRVISRSELQDKKHEVKMAKIKLEQAQYNLDISKTKLEEAQRSSSQFTTLSPKDGIVLQINAHLHEFVGGAQQIMLLGDAKKIIVRVSIDEHDIKNYKSTASAYLTSNDEEELKIPLKYLQLEQYIIKQERLNSRVLEALYFFNRDDYPQIVAGQQLDAHIVLQSKTKLQ